MKIVSSTLEPELLMKKSQNEMHVMIHIIINLGWGMFYFTCRNKDDKNISESFDCWNRVLHWVVLVKSWIFCKQLRRQKTRQISNPEFIALNINLEGANLVH